MIDGVNIERITAPWVRLGVEGELPFNGILVNIPAGFNKVRWGIDLGGAISSLENMADIVIFFVEINGVAGMEGSYDIFEWNIVGFDQQMNVVGH